MSPVYNIDSINRNKRKAKRTPTRANGRARRLLCKTLGVCPPGRYRRITQAVPPSRTSGQHWRLKRTHTFVTINTMHFPSSWRLPYSYNSNKNMFHLHSRDNFTHSFSRIIFLTPTACCCSWIQTGILESIYPIIHRARGSVSVQANPTTRLRSQIHTWEN